MAMNGKQERGAAARRAKYGASTALLLFAATAAAAMAIALSAVYAMRIDLTTAGAQGLSQRSKQLLRSLEEPHEIIVALDPPGAGGQSLAGEQSIRRRVFDVLREFDRASEFVRFSTLSAVSRADREAYEGLLERLVDLSEDAVAANAEATQGLLEAAGRLSEGLESLAERLHDVADAGATDQAGALRQSAGVVRSWAAEAERLRATVNQDSLAPVRAQTLVAIDQVRQQILQPIRRMGEQLVALAASLDQIAAGGGAEVQAVARNASNQARALGERATSSADVLERLEAPQALAVARTLETGPAVVIVSPSGATAVQFSALFPSAQTLAASGASVASVRFVGEELIATALASLSSERNPVVILTHGIGQRLLDAAGNPATAEARRLLGAFLDRNRLRGVDVLEWAVTVDDGPPGTAEVDPEGVRPIVHVTLGAAALTPQGAERLGKVSEVVKHLVEEGKPTLICVEPSQLPTVGEPDPMTVFLEEELGLRVKSGLPLLHRESRPSGPLVTPATEIAGGEQGHPIGEALSGLRTLLGWAVPIELAEKDDANATGSLQTWPILLARKQGESWAESEWLRFRSLSATQRAMLADPPTPQPQFDDVDGPWIVAAATQRNRAAGAAPERFVVVGSNGWFFDEFTMPAERVEGRYVASHPGNIELYEASLYWLAGLDELIAPSARSMEISRIGALSEGQAMAIRWAIAAGLPALVIIAAAAWRLARG